MAIKIECTQCRFRNDLGRIFCAQCGVKLNLKRTAQSDLEDRREVQYGLVIGKIVGGLLTITVIGSIAFVAWPLKPQAVRRDPAGRQSVVEKTRAVKQALMAGRGASVDFSEGEVNGFLNSRAATRQLKALTVDIRPGAMDLRAWFSWRPSVVTNLTWLPKNDVAALISIEMTATFNGGQMKITGGRLGHFPLVGPMTRLPKQFFSGVFYDVVAENRMIAMLTDVTFEQDVAHVKFGK